MYVAVKGGEKAIDNAHRWLAELRRGDQAVAELELDQIVEQLSLSVARVMAEGSLFDPRLAALAIKQARGDLIEAIFLVRAFRTTLPRFGGTSPVNTGAMICSRRISATFKDIPGGQILGPTFDYTHRLLDFDLAETGQVPAAEQGADDATAKPHVLGLIGREGLMQAEHATSNDDAIPDLTREPLTYPADRAVRLQALARGDEGFILGLGYSTQRGYARNHAFVGELRIGLVEVEMDIPELGFAITIGEIEITEDACHLEALTIEECWIRCRLDRGRQHRARHQRRFAARPTKPACCPAWHAPTPLWSVLCQQRVATPYSGRQPHPVMAIAATADLDRSSCVSLLRPMLQSFLWPYPDSRLIWGSQR